MIRSSFGGNDDLPKPKEIKEELDAYVIGQEKSQKDISGCCLQSL